MKILVAHFLEYAERIKNRSEHTVRSYQNDLDGFCQYCIEQYEVDDISVVNHLMIRSWVMELKRNGIANTSINRKLSAMRSFYKYLRKKGIVEANPMTKVLALKKGKRLPSYVPEKKMDYLLESPIEVKNFVDYRDYLIVSLLYFTGMRRSELLHLKFSDIDSGRMEIKVIGKGNKERRCPISPAVLKDLEFFKGLLQDVFPNRVEEYVITTEKGKKAYPKLVYNIVSRMLKSVNASVKTSPHVLRHTFATHLASHGAELNAVKELLGHASLAATQVYTHNSIERLKNEYAKAHPKGE